MEKAWYREVLSLVWDAILAVVTNDIWREKIIKRSLSRLQAMEKGLQKASVKSGREGGE